ANNAKIVRGAPGRVDASRGIQVLDVPATRVDRSMGDVHPHGNPHYSLDPGLAPIITENIVDGLARFAPELRQMFEKNRQAFLARLDEAMARWSRALAPLKGATAAVCQPRWIYVLHRSGRIQAAALRDRRCSAAPRAHLCRCL